MMIIINNIIIKKKFLVFLARSITILLGEELARSNRINNSGHSLSREQ